MGKLEPFEGKTTTWQGLWWHPEINAFTSSVLNLADLRKFKGQFRIKVRKNKFFNNGENGRPNYNFVIRDAHSAVFRDIEVQDDDCCNIQEKIEELADVMRQGNLNGDRMALPSESVANAKALMMQAITLVEEITGEKWEFSAMTF